MHEVILKKFAVPDEVRIFPKGRFELVRIGSMTIGRATYEPGWKWSVDVGAALGQTSCMVEHTGLVLAGAATAAMNDGNVVEMRPGDLFYIAPGHDSWVIGYDPYVSLHFEGADSYASANNAKDKNAQAFHSRSRSYRQARAHSRRFQRAALEGRAAAHPR